MIRLVDVAKTAQVIREEFLKYCGEIIDSGRFVQGRWVEEFEQEFSRISRLLRVVAVSSGTAANHLSLQVLELEKGSEVLIPVNTFIATAWGVIYSGLEVKFCDVNEDTFNMDEETIRLSLSPRTRAVVVVHLYGQPADMDGIMNLVEKQGLILVEDCAQAHLAEYKGRPVGSFGLTAAFSFYPGKNLGAFGEGGALVCQSNDLEKRARIMRNQGMERKYLHTEVGHNYRMPEMIGLSLALRVRFLPEWTKRRRDVAQMYRERLQGVDDVILPKELPDRNHSYHLFVIRVPSNVRDRFCEFMRKREIEVGLHYPIPLHLQPCFADLGYKKGQFPVAERLSQEVVSLPMHPFLSDGDVEKVCEAIRQFFIG